MRLTFEQWNVIGGLAAEYHWEGDAPGSMGIIVQRDIDTPLERLADTAANLEHNEDTANMTVIVTVVPLPRSRGAGESYRVEPDGSWETVDARSVQTESGEHVAGQARVVAKLRGL
jgi:hypothetical protein